MYYRLQGAVIEQVSSLKYLSTLVNQQSDANVEIKARIEQAREILNNLKMYLGNRNFSLRLDYSTVTSFL